MKHRASIFAVALVTFAVALGGCARRSDTALSSNLTEDDDTFCRANGTAPGSSDYVACRKNRDAQRSNAVARADKTQRNLGEMMLNNPENGMRR